MKQGKRNYEATKEYKELRRSLLEHLQARGMVEQLYVDKVQEYMDFWVQRKRLEEDIATRGICVLVSKRQMPVENRSVSLAVQVSRQMLAIYQALGFKEDAACGKGIEDDEL